MLAILDQRSILIIFLFFNSVLPVSSAGTQFITGACASDSDCAEGCCAFNTGKCAGPIVAQERDGGCGFGNATPNDNAAVALGFTGPVGTGKASSTAATTAAVSTAIAPGTQFITGACTSDQDCAEGCCGFNSGKCAGPIVAQERDGGCGFGDAAPNDNAAKALGFTGQVGGGTAATTLATMIAPASTSAAATATKGTQFITGPCSSDIECADGCCGFNSGKCAGPVVAQERDGGCGFGDAAPNDNAAVALGFTGQVGKNKLHRFAFRSGYLV